MLLNVQGPSPHPIVVLGASDAVTRSAGEVLRQLRAGRDANARRLLDAMERLEAGPGEAHDLLETD